MDQLQSGSGERGEDVRLALLLTSFLALFLELMLIRWVPTSVLQVAYFANLLLISSFLGLGLGALLSSRRDWFHLFPVFLLAEVLLVVACKGHVIPVPGGEVRFGGAAPGSVLGYSGLLGSFALNTLTFVPLGQRLGRLFQRLPALQAYTWDLAGSLAGTIAHGAFSYCAFSPVVGIVVAGLVFALVARRAALLGTPVILVAAIAAQTTIDPSARWSPYHYITVSAVGSDSQWALSPPPDLRERRDPPIYVVSVNRFFLQVHGTLAPERYTDPTVAKMMVEHYSLPYALGGAPPRRVLVLGAGGGVDVEAALRAGASAVDAVEIDPGLIELARRYNASGVYDDPRVRLVTDDARAALKRLSPGYDRIIFGLLDSQALFSAHGSVRMDGFVHTVESYRAAWRLLSPNGALVVSFFVSGQQWLADKLLRMVTEATGQAPLSYTDGTRLVLVAPRGPMAPPATFGAFSRVELVQRDAPIATDDWPYLYLRGRSVPIDYALVIGGLALVSVIFVGALLPPGGDRRHESQMFFLGLGFLLLQTKSISDCALYVGSTWLVCTLVIAGVLLMVLLANLAVLRGARGHYPALFLALALVCLTPRETVLEASFAGRLAWTLLAVPLPIFFAGVIFSTSFRAGRSAPALFGANLIGATVGGFAEYLGMVLGSAGLAAVIAAAYALSWLCAPRRAR